MQQKIKDSYLENNKNYDDLKRFTARLRMNIGYVRYTKKEAMFEVGARAELTLWYDNDVGNRGFYNPDYKLYAFAGVAGYYSNPQGRLVYDPADSLVDNPGDLQPGCRR